MRFWGNANPNLEVNKQFGPIEIFHMAYFGMVRNMPCGIFRTGVD